jgi:hypothetical protein
MVLPFQRIGPPLSSVTVLANVFRLRALRAQLPTIYFDRVYVESNTRSLKL